jgi:hypothetical protein
MELQGAPCTYQPIGRKISVKTGGNSSFYPTVFWNLLLAKTVGSWQFPFLV